MMSKHIEVINNEKGVTLFELIISVVVASMVLSMLMSILTVTITNKARLEVKNKLINESYVITETIQSNLFDKQPQEIVVTKDDADGTIIEFRHIRDIVINGTILQDPEYVDPNPDILYYNRVDGEITYNGVLLHDDDINILPESTLEAISIDGSCDFGATVCTEAVIKLTFVVSLSFKDGTINSQTYITTIII